jgi:hypothetical protein
MRAPTRLGIAAALLTVACAACSTILGIGDLDAGEPRDGASDGQGPSDSTTADGTTEGGGNDAPDTSDADASAGPDRSGDTSAGDSSTVDASGGNDASDSGELPDTFIVPYDGGFADAPLNPSPIVAVGNVMTPTGNAQQNHLVVASNEGRGWYFYIDDDSTKIKARVSSDFVNWSDGGALSLGTGTNSGLGNDFSVAYANLATTDVVHLIVSEIVVSTGAASAIHLRTTIAGPPGAGQLAVPQSIVEINPGEACSIDGPSTVVGTDGKVFDATGLSLAHPTQCDQDIYQSSVSDDGGTGTWSATFSQTGYFVVSPGLTGAHQLIAFAAPGAIGGAFANGSHFEQPYTGVSWSKTAGTDLWDAGPVDVFPNNDAGVVTASEGLDDWSLCRIGDTEVHAVRHLTDSSFSTATSFQHAIYNGGTWVQQVNAPAGMTSMLNTGTVLVSNSTLGAVLAMVIGSDNSINAAQWANGSWSAWRVVLPAGPLRTALAGSGCGSVHPMVFWTEGQPEAGSGQTIIGADVSGFF